MLDGDDIFTSAQIRAMESRAIASGAISGTTLMERAGTGVVDAILAHWPQLAARGLRRAAVLCGPGNNGGDGFVVARLLAAQGWHVDVLLAGDPAALPPDARLNHDRWRLTAPVHALSNIRMAVGADLMVDALFGIGLRRPLDPMAQVLDTLRAIPHTVAVDVPSGLCADSGRVISASTQPLAADLTVTLHRAKPGHLLAEGPRLCGQVTVVDIGLPGCAAGPVLVSVTGADLAKRQGHKFDHGHALVIAGGAGQGGAARLVGRAALRIGAGLVTLCPPYVALPEHAGPPDALMRRALDSPADLATLLQDRRITAICLGPGCGISRSAALLPVLLKARCRTVLDADAISALAARNAPFASLHDGCVLTPHAGEFGRLFPDLAARLDERALAGPAYSRLDAAQAAAARSGAVIVLKGPDTVIAAPNGAAFLHSAHDVPWLATAGSGDVLAGLIAGLLARGLPIAQAAAAAALVHAHAARSFGAGLIADDLPDHVPPALRALMAPVSPRT